MDSMTLVFVGVVLTAHLVGDWYLQAWSTQMSIKKSSDNGWLMLHVYIVTVTLALAMMALYSVTDWFTPRQAMAYAIANGAAHWVTDYVTSRVNARNWYIRSEAVGDKYSDTVCTLVVDNLKRFWFWSGIGTDQWIHGITYLVTAWWLL